MATQPTILVKKSDGAFERMSWDEFQRYRTQNTINKTQRIDDRMQNTYNRMQAKPTDKIITPKSEIITPNSELRTPNSELPAKIGEEALATTTPVKEIFVDEAKYVRTYEKDTKLRTTKETSVRPIRIQNKDNRKQTTSEVKSWTADDNRPLLEDSIDETMKAKAVSVLPDKRDNLYDLFIKEIRFSIKDEIRGRLNSLAVSFAKGVRTEDQVRGYLQRGEAEGGLGFSEAQAEAVIAAIKKVWHSTNTPPAPLREGSVTIPLRGEGDVPTHHQPLHDNGYHKLPPRRRAGEVLGINAKPVLQDVAPPKVEEVEKAAMGPIDEIATMTLIDFRRLATGGADSVQVLRDKFSALRKESIVLYLQARQAWFSSPLYHEYQGLITRAVNERRKLQEVVGESGIKFEEFIKLANLCSSL